MGHEQGHNHSAIWCTYQWLTSSCVRTATPAGITGVSTATTGIYINLLQQHKRRRSHILTMRKNQTKSNQLLFFVHYFSMEHLTVCVGVFLCLCICMFVFIFCLISICVQVFVHICMYMCVFVCVFNRIAVYLCKISAKIETLFSPISQNDRPKRTQAAVLVFVFNFCTRHARTKYNKHAYILKYVYYRIALYVADSILFLQSFKLTQN